ncbi:perilipin-2-like isoform X3 [Notolabrus celidotus]|uniref:perilipin-2-like isoform X3 n=1 Tax=Notolabrus celidotus TaxID=1203425 RepID=UPI0014906648|nr:perilipin-2-like isoform X3 [Notolabrus celidotus]
MPMNNNQKFQSAAARLAKLPLVRSACSTVSVLYIDTKSSHPNLRSVCEVLESRVTAISTAACDKMTPVMVRLEPQISIVNDVACKSLDWLETTFPVLHAPTDQVVAAARNKMNEIQDVVSITANGTVDTVTWLMGRIQQVDEQTNQPLVQRAIGVADVGLDSALIMSETLMEHMLPLSEEDKEAEAHLLEGFEVATLRRSYRARLLLLAARLCSRTYHLVGSKIQSVQVCFDGEFVQVFRSDSGPSDQLADHLLEHPGAASVSATSACVCSLLYLTDVQLEQLTIPTATSR